MAIGSPSKKIFLLIIACVFGVGLIGFAVYTTRANGQKQGTTLTYTDNTKNAAAIEATDKKMDAVPNQNPPILGTSDKLPNHDSKTETNKTTEDASKAVQTDNTQTGRISRELFANYIAAKQSGATLDKNIQNQIIQQTFADKSLGVPSKVYAAADIQINQGSDFKKYGNDLGVAFSAGKIKNSVSEIQILQNALTKNAPTEIEKLDPIISAYSAVVDQMTTLSVPRDSIALHLALLNSLNKVLSNIKGFRMIFDDPVVGLVSVGNYFKDVQTLQSAIKDVQSDFAIRGVAYDQTEYGYIFTKTSK